MLTAKKEGVSCYSVGYNQSDRTIHGVTDGDVSNLKVCTQNVKSYTSKG